MAAQLKTTYVIQIKELPSFVEIGGLTQEQYEQRDSILQQMVKLNPKIYIDLSIYNTTILSLISHQNISITSYFTQSFTSITSCEKCGQ